MVTKSRTQSQQPVQTAKQPALQWDDFKDRAPDDAARAIYEYIDCTSGSLIAWYWRAIAAKKKAAMWTRFVAFAALIFGAVTQIYLGSLDDATERLHFTQGSLALLALGALLIQVDRSFGWTSGWTRYVTTVMKMETLTSEFKLSWAATQLGFRGALIQEDVVRLFELARGLETELLKARDDETLSWATEFSNGLQVLESAIKAQRETAERTLDDLSSASKKKASDASPGAIEIALTFKNPATRVKIRFDAELAVEIFGASWAKPGVPPGQHHLEILAATDDRILEARIVEVSAGETARLAIELGDGS